MSRPTNLLSCWTSMLLTLSLTLLQYVKNHCSYHRLVAISILVVVFGNRFACMLHLNVFNQSCKTQKTLLTVVCITYHNLLLRISKSALVQCHLPIYFSGYTDNPVELTSFNTYYQIYCYVLAFSSS